MIEAGLDIRDHEIPGPVTAFLLQQAEELELLDLAVTVVMDPSQRDRLYKECAGLTWPEMDPKDWPGQITSFSAMTIEVPEDNA